MNGAVIAALKPTIAGVASPRCGSCVYAQEFRSDNSADCYGHPPTVLVMGVARDPLGRPAAQLETFVPRVQRDRPACALYRPKQNGGATAG